MPRIEFQASSPVSLTLTEAKEMTNILTIVQDALADNGYPMDEDPRISAGTLRGLDARFIVTFGDN